MIKKIYSIVLIFTSLIGNEKDVLIIDTANNDPYQYRTIITLSRSLGYQASYKHIYEIKPEIIKNFNAIILSLDSSFFSATAEQLRQNYTIKHLLLQRIYSLIDAMSKQNNKTILVMLPSVGKSAALLAMSHKLLGRLGALEKHPENPQLEALIKNSLMHILQSDAAKSFRYDTALLYAQEKDFNAKKWHVLEKDNEIIAAPLPIDNNMFTKVYELQPLYPLGLYLKNRSNNNQFFIMNASALTFADIQESFIYNPVDHPLRKKLLESVYASIAEFYHAAEIHSLEKNTKKPSIPVSLNIENYRQKQKRIQKEHAMKLDKKTYARFLHEDIRCGFLLIEPYLKNIDYSVENLLKLGFNMLWLTLRPEWYLSRNALNPGDKENFFKNLSIFTKALVEKSKELKIPIPKLFVGMELTGNFGKYPPQNPAIDIYGRIYSKIPSPLDFQHFWKPELLDVFDAFYTEWQNSIGNGIPLSGVFLDFEMYHAQNQTGQFLATMDFSDVAWQLFIKAQNKSELAKLIKTQERVAYLLQNNLFQRYFKILQNEAEKIGHTIKNHIHQKLPHGIIAGYNLNLPYNWFYKGLLAGLSSPEHPIIFATFSNEFYPHYDWLIKNNIHLLHLPVVLLSKIQKKEDFKKITNLSQYHDGVWFNRISRLEEPPIDNAKQLDLRVEYTPLNTQEFIYLLNQWIKQNCNKS